MKVVTPLLAAVVCSAVVFAQQAPSSQTQAKPAATQEQAQPTSQDDQLPPPRGKVLFSRSSKDAQQPEAKEAESANAKVSDTERSAVTFTAYDLDVHLQLKEQGIAVRARVTVRNDGSQALTQLPLQLSSSLKFESISIEGQKLAFSQQIINSDADHTGQLREVVVVLPKPLAPQSEQSLNVVYSGAIPASTKRLEDIGTPADLAQQSDWDEISEDFTGLRGFGDVVWYPVSSVPQALGEGAKLFTEIGRQKLRSQNAQVSMRVTAEYIGTAPNSAVIDGHFIAVQAPAVTPTASFPGVVTFSLPATRLGFGTLDLFLATRITHEANGIRVLAADYDEPNVQGYLTAATMVQPLIEQWLGSKPKEPLTIFDLPDKHAAAFEQGAVTATGLQALEPQDLANALSHGMAHAYFESPRQWLNEGVANFLGTLWIEQTKGRDAALEHLEASRGALAVGEPSSPGEGSGQPLIEAADAVYYRNKSTYVLWMLRDLAGDKALAAALRAYDPKQDTAPEYFEHLVEQASGKDLKWFFDDWVYHDKGLPDLSIAAIYPATSSQSGQYIVAIDLANDGYAAAEVPVTVRSQASTQTVRVQIPARSKVTHRMLVQGLPTEVIVNDGVVPELQASVHRHDINMTDGKQ
ncbi:hypothetical protein H7849_04655 [Alloacidobacterium dinghuense]|uniref:Peptidase M1 membrane alanine aminopeptidase domain-containing protein n=1 Tax=Alloacidobacterium dinghuense TaxID=2763107 RepID=A0A7G8BL39_9BACT|nr:hypothetical protein [Alloacidobacterium dinghuense]QNI33259.1 hypothetical protein H7849_04655 [Alloacidobacterium dinghuense]